MSLIANDYGNELFVFCDVNSPGCGPGAKVGPSKGKKINY